MRFTQLPNQIQILERPELESNQINSNQIHSEFNFLITFWVTLNDYRPMGSRAIDRVGRERRRCSCYECARTGGWHACPESSGVFPCLTVCIGVVGISYIFSIPTSDGSG